MTVLMSPARLSMSCSPKFATRRRPERESFGGEIASIGAALGQPFMPWQNDVAAVGGEIDRVTGLPAYRQVIITVPRQQGKTTLCLSWQLHRCTAPRWAQPQRSAFTAQSGKDARDKWLDEIFPLMRASKLFRPRGPLVTRLFEGMGNEGVRFRNGSLIRLLSTATSTGHSKSIHQAVLDELWHDSDSRREQGLRPAMITIPDAQLLVVSTQGTDASVVLDRKVAAGRAAAQADTGYGIAYFEFSAPDGWDPEDEASYFTFMPALCPDPPCRCGGGKWRHTVTLDAIRSEREDSSMTAAEFARAYGNIPDRSGRVTDLADMSNWADCADPGSRVADPVALGFSVAPGGSSAAVAVGGRRADGLGHGEVVEHRPGTAWLVGRLCELADRWKPCATVMNPAGAARAFEKELIERGFVVTSAGKDPPPGQWRLHMTGMGEYAAACGALQADVAAARWRWLGRAAQESLDDAVAVARTRLLADAWAWSWRNSKGDIGPLEAVTLARHGHATYGVNPGVFFGSWR
jgi:hypothetical protein